MCAARGRRRGGPGRSRRPGKHPAPELFGLLPQVWGPHRVRLRRQIEQLRDAAGAGAVGTDEAGSGTAKPGSTAPGSPAADLPKDDSTTNGPATGESAGAESEFIRQRRRVRRAVDDSVGFVAERYDGRPRPELADGLPISGAGEEIAQLIRDHQVVIVAGETGSGKTTQLPKIALQAGRGRTGLIGHTQPRRLAARSVASRIAQEMGTELGEVVGFSVRFTDQTSDDTFIRLMTDGILLSEISRDRFLNKYDTIIIDEAHERSLNIDFLLGYLKQLLPKRPDLKLIVTSATIDVERFSEHFDDAPVIEVSGRSYPVEVRYRPLEEMPSHVDDFIGGIVEATAELCAEGSGDILVFLSGEREIRDTMDALVGAKSRFRGPPIDVVPLFARLSAGEQNKIFASHTGRRIVLSTNVAETSITVPGIKYVIDVGTARISRFSNRLKVQRLPIEPVSQASANQRAGRCGRVSAGVCIRLYSEDDYNGRPEFTDPEILRTNLASVILTMAAMRLGDVSSFPFVQPPQDRHIRDGRQLLYELGALRTPDRPGAADSPTPVGRHMSRLPIDPRLSRMIVAAADNGCVDQVLTIASALSIQDPRERPLEAKAQADQCHATYADKSSDFLTWLNLWQHLQEKQTELSSSAFRRYCKQHYLHFVRIREWQDIRGQLRSLAKDATLDVTSSSTDEDSIHQAVLVGLLSHIGVWDTRSKEYFGSRGAKFAIFPGSSVAKAKPSVVMAAELVETSRLWGRHVAGIRAEWAEKAAGDLVKRQYTNPHWSKKRGAVVAGEKVTLFGVPLVVDRTVTFSRIDPEFCREEFIRRALVEGEWTTDHEFFSHNTALLDDVRELQSRARRHDLIVSDEDLFAFYDSRIPDHVVSSRHFDSWWKKHRKNRPELLHFTRDDVTAEDTDTVDTSAYPSHWHHGSIALPLEYQFDVGSGADGVTVVCDVTVLNQLSANGFDWSIPGLREEVVTALLRSLPKPIRRSIVPVPDTAKAICAGLPSSPGSTTLTRALSDTLARSHRLTITDDDWDWSAVPDHLRMTFKIVRGDHVVATGKDLEALLVHAADDVAQVVAEATASFEQPALAGFPADGVPESVSEPHAPGGTAVQVTGHPALVARGGQVSLKVLPHPGVAAAEHTHGVATLAIRDAKPLTSGIQRQLSDTDKLTLAMTPDQDVAATVADLGYAVVCDLIAAQNGPIVTPEQYARLLAEVNATGQQRVSESIGQVVAVVAAGQQAQKAIPKTANLHLLASLNDLKASIAEIYGPGFVRRVGVRRLPDLVRYLTAAAYRAAKLADNAAADQVKLREFSVVHEQYTKLLGFVPATATPPTELDEMLWTLHEYRIHLFAPHIRTRESVSTRRLTKLLASLERTLR